MRTSASHSSTDLDGANLLGDHDFMTELLRLRGLGVRVEVRCKGARAALLASAMRDAWSRCLDVRGIEEADSRTFELIASPVEVRLDNVADLASRLMLTTQEITRALITPQIGRLLMLHAGCVSHPESGESLVYVAPGGTGKTTLSRRLGARYGYVTDETVGIDEAGIILPYPKPLSIRRVDESGIKDEVSPDQLGLRRTPATTQIGRVVLLDRQTNAGPVDVEELGLMEALFALAEQTSSLHALPAPLRRLEQLIDRAGPIYRYRYREASDIEPGLVGLIGSSR